jgi:protein-tyrosine phosphatase
MNKTDDPHADYSYSLVQDQLYLGYNMCDDDHFETLKKLGVDADINVEGEHPEQAHGMEVSMWLPTPEHESPSPAQLFVGGNAIRNLIQVGKTVYVHCEKGHVRSAVVVGAYLVLTGMSSKDALDFIREKRPVIHPNDGHYEALKAFESEYGS